MKSGCVVHHSKFGWPMSALGHKRTWRGEFAMSALPPKADIGTHPRNVRFVPKATSADSFDHLVGPLQDCFGKGDAKRQLGIYAGKTLKGAKPP
jgi:hypothetical protein